MTSNYKSLSDVDMPSDEQPSIHDGSKKIEHKHEEDYIEDVKDAI